MKKAIFSVSIVLLSLCGSSRAAIEGVVAPAELLSLGNIYRSTVYRDGNTVKYGECDTLESHCTPESNLLTIKREMPYEDYVRRLADRFDVSPKYLLHHEEALESFWSYLDTLDGILEDQSSTQVEKDAALRKLGAMTHHGAILDRFLQALTIKANLEWKRGGNAAARDQESLESLRARIQAPALPEGRRMNPDDLLGEFLTAAASEDSDERDVYQKYLRMWRFVESGDADVRRELGTQIVRALIDPSRLGDSTELTEALAKVATLRHFPAAGINPSADLPRISHRFARYMEDQRVRPVIELNKEPLKTQIGDVTYEQSIKQFEQAFYPVNFATILGAEPTAKTIFEPSTQKTWTLAATAATRLDAESACPRGSRLALSSEVSYAAAWLEHSTIGSQIPVVQARKRVWAPGVAIRRGRKLRTVNKNVEIGFRTFANRPVDEYETEVHFSYVNIDEKHCGVGVEVIRTGEELGSLTELEALQKFGARTTAIGVLCVTDRFPKKR